MHENPFSTRWVRPGAIGFLFPAGESAATVVDRLRAAGWWGQIIGPHGSGKSTLLASLEPVLEAAGRRTLRIALHDGQRRLPVELEASGPLRDRESTGACSSRPTVTPATQVIIDGYEQLGWPARWRLKRLCRRRGCGLLVTAHTPVGFPTLFQTRIDPETALQVVERLCPLDSSAGRITAADVLQRLAAQQGNLREALFDLYDLYERRRNS